MAEIKPIKRSVELQSLSREHHDGLLFVWKLRAGLKRNIAIDKLKAYTTWYWKNHIKQHFYQEEKILVPFFETSDPLVSRMKEEHDYIRELIIAIGKEPVQHDFVLLANLIESHIRFEERELFNYLEINLSAPELKNVQLLIEEKPVSCNEEWQDHFWEVAKS